MSRSSKGHTDFKFERKKSGLHRGDNPSAHRKIASGRAKKGRGRKRY